MKTSCFMALVLLGVSTDLNVSQVNALATKNQAQLKAKASSTAKALSTAESKSASKAEAQEKDFFYQPFQQILAQGQSTGKDQQ